MRHGPAEIFVSNFTKETKDRIPMEERICFGLSKDSTIPDLSHRGISIRYPDSLIFDTHFFVYGTGGGGEGVLNCGGRFQKILPHY